MLNYGIGLYPERRICLNFKRWRIIGVLSAVILALFALSSSTQGFQSADPNEPNDSESTATSIQTPYRAENLQIDPSGDLDFFRLELTEISEVEVIINADQVGSTLDPVAFLLDESGDILRLSDDAIGLDPLIQTELGVGVYFVVVAGFFDLSTGFYNIEINAQGIGDCIQSELAPDEDQLWNLGAVAPGSRIQVTLIGPGNADLDLFLSEVISIEPQVTVTVGASLSASSQERVSYQVEGTQAREFIARVSSFEGGGDYLLCASITPPVSNGM